ncbi:MAG: RagB/SusD family nutrient uptake outer membrane protein [Bacteroidetes bacterium]|nr:RagB/SusD family nutrient uptake outer membrane protein [Bacteroidota bacterium]
MKRYKIISPLVTLALLAVCGILPVACHKNLLNQPATTQPSPATFWKTEQDATEALQGLYASIRPCFDRDYYLDGQSEYFRCRGTSTTSGNLRLGDAYNGGNYNPSGYAASFDKMYMYLYGAIDNANYVIANVQRMQSTSTVFASSKVLSTIVAESRLLRGLAYFRLISMWGDVPYYTFAPTTNDQVQSLSRMPIKQIKDSILADYTYAYNNLPDPGKTDLGRASKVAALALRGKLYLYWGSWNKYGWPELEGFTPSTTDATAAFTAAAADLHSVSYDFPVVTLYLNGDPGQTDSLGHADVLPNYFNLFMPKANGNPEMLLVFTHGGTGTAQGEELMRDFAGRSHEGSQCWVSPRYELADRYQLISTGDFAPKLKPMNPTVPANGNVARTTLNSAVNPNSYAGRDYRMKATIQWDYEVSQGSASQKSTGWVPFIYKSWAAKVNIGGVDYLTYNTDGCNSGYVFRKFVRNYAGQGRSDGDFAWPVIRLADVYLMYAEAANEINNGPTADAIDLVNRVRHRGNLPPLGPTRTDNYQDFFDAVEQERIVELVGEGQRGFDLRRWRAIERVWGPPGSAGVWRIDTWGANQQRYFQNTSDLEYHQDYIFRIPLAERDKNPNLTQNIPWR